MFLGLYYIWVFEVKEFFCVGVLGKRGMGYNFVGKVFISRYNSFYVVGRKNLKYGKD